MASRLKIVRTVPSLRRALELCRKSGERIALVPTMGALHRGHMALVREARQRAKRVVVSIFVNPTQFAPNEDFASYPRSFATDLKALRETNVDLVWAPSVEAMYPAGYATRLAPKAPPKWAWRMNSDRIFLAASQPSWPSCSRRYRPISRYSVKRTISSSVSSPKWRRTSISQ